MAYKVYYSFLHDNQVPYETDYYKLYRQEVIGGTSGTYIQVAQITPTGLGKNLIISGVDLVNDCNIEYNYKVSAYNDNAEIFCINPLYSGVEFICPTPSSTSTPTPNHHAKCFSDTKCFGDSNNYSEYHVNTNNNFKCFGNSNNYSEYHVNTNNNFKCFGNSNNYSEYHVNTNNNFKRFGNSNNDTKCIA